MNLRFGIVVLAAISLRPAMGLDPSRTLTQYVHRVWQTQQGLPEGSVYAIAQTHDGSLWLGTQGGLIRFYGVRFETNEKLNVWVRSAVEDSHHALWVATNTSGLYRIAGETITQYLNRDSIGCLAVAVNGDVWACTPNGMARIRDGKAALFSTAQGLTSNAVRAVCEAGD